MKNVLNQFNIQKHKYNFAIYIGRFQGFHNGQLANIIHGLNIAEKLIILVGSANKPITWKNPWTAEQRIEMIKASLTPEQIERIYFSSTEDRLYQDSEWEALVYNAVDAILLDYSKYRLNSFKEEHRPKIALVGCDKDDTTWYLQSFPNWKQEFTTAFVPESHESPLNATFIRNVIYNWLNPSVFGHPRYLEAIKPLMPEGAFEYIKRWGGTDAARYVYDWHEADRIYQHPYEKLPYPSNFYCADNVVIQSGHVLLIKRKEHPGKGLWALPGGHIEVDENSFEGALRELDQETGLKVPEKILKASYIGKELFDHPERSLRGRCGKITGRTVSISHCFYLTGGEGLPRVKAGDDAEEAWWFNVGEVKNMRNQIFEDHLDQINFWLAQLRRKES